MSWHEDMARRGIDSDTSLDLDDNQSNNQGKTRNINDLQIFTSTKIYFNFRVF